MHADLSRGQSSLIDWLLPSDRPFYSAVKERILSLPLHEVDAGLIFGDYDDAFAETITIGQVDIGGSSHPVLVRMNDDRTGAMISMPSGDLLTPLWTLSSWSPGAPAPSGAALREIALLNAGRDPLYTLALSPSERVLWLHHTGSQFNQLLPVTGLLIELARLRGAPAADRLSNSAFFDLAADSTDRTLVKALLNYNYRAKKFDASKVINLDDRRKPGSFLDLIRRRR